MPTHDPAPLTEQDYHTINQRLADLQRIRLDIERAASGGVVCDEHDTVCKDLQRQYEALKKAYFPDRS